MDTTMSNIQLIPNINMNLSSSEKVFHSTMIQVRQSAVTSTSSSSSFFSDPVRLSLTSSYFNSSLFGSDAILSELIVSIANNDGVSNFVFGENSTTTFQGICFRGYKESLTFICPHSNVVLTQECNGIAGNFTKHCPMVEPTCSSLQFPSINVTSLGCQLLSYSSLKTECLCVFNSSTLSSSGRRVLSSTNSSQLQTLFNSKRSVDFVAATEFVAMDFKETFDIFRGSATQQVWIIVLMFGWSLGSGVFVYFVFIYLEAVYEINQASCSFQR